MNATDSRNLLDYLFNFMNKPEFQIRFKWTENTATMREFDAAGRPSIGSAPVGYEGTASWLESVGEVFGVSKAKISKAKNAVLPNIKKSLKENKLKGRITVSGYEGSELIVARLLSESGIDVPYVEIGRAHV